MLFTFYRSIYCGLKLQVKRFTFDEVFRVYVKPTLVVHLHILVNIR